MSDPVPALSTNPANINPTGANPQALQEYQDSLEAQLKSLEDRYSNPNWFKVAAGFLKPQLGGFAASLGSASEALGENVEAGRAAALPIAQMRSQLAQSRILTGQNKDTSDEIIKWQNEHQGETPPATLVAKWANVAPGLPAVQSMLALQETNLKQRTLAHNEFSDALTRINYANTHGMTPDPADEALVSKNPKTTPPPSQTKTDTSGAAGSDTASPKFTGSASDIVDSINAIADPTERQAAMDQYLMQLGITPASKSGKVSAAPAAPAAPANTGRTREQDIESQKTNTTTREAPYENIVQNWANSLSSLPEEKTRISTMTNLLDGNKAVTDKNGKTTLVNDPSLSLIDKFDVLRQQGALGALLNTAQEGIQANTPYGSWALSVPVKSSIASLKLTTPQQKRFEELTRLLAVDRLKQNNPQQFGGGHENQAQFAAAQSIAPVPFDPSANLHAYIDSRAADVDYREKAHAAYNAWRQKNPASALVSQFINSPEHTDLLKSKTKALTDASYNSLR